MLNFLKGWNNVKKKNCASNTADRYGALLPIACFGTQLHCIFPWLKTFLRVKIALKLMTRRLQYDFKLLSPGCFIIVRPLASHKSGFFIIIRVFLKIYHSQYTWVFYNIILFIIFLPSFVPCQCYSFMCHSTLRSLFALVCNFSLCAISLCDF